MKTRHADDRPPADHGQENLVLIGMPGAGKSTVGRLLSASLDRPFLDTDELLESRRGKPLQEIIDGVGVDRFCELEAELILSLDREGEVIATGGSVVYRQEAMDHLQDGGLVVYLAARLETVRRRVTDPHSRGIAMAAGQSLADLYRERTPLYERYADLKASCDERTPEKIVAHILDLLGGR